MKKTKCDDFIGYCAMQYLYKIFLEKNIILSYNIKDTFKARRQWKMKKYIYLLLTRSNTIFSRAMYKVTKDEFTHISLSLDDELKIMYSFCRRYPNLPLPAGFTSESIYHGFYKKNHTIPCNLYRIEVTHEKYKQLQSDIALLMEKSEELKYDVLGTMLCQFDIEHERENYRYCSWFVAEALGNLDILEFEKHYSLVKPMDFTKIPHLELIYRGTVGELAIAMKVNRISNKCIESAFE